MEHYVTLFDSLFLPQGISLHRSMERHVGPYTLWVLCVDSLAYEMLERLKLPNVRLMSLHDVETDSLKNVKKERTRAEYCWTLTPHVPGFVFDRDQSAERVTYVDADFWFMKPPRAIFQELEVANKPVLIVEHAYAPDYDQSATSGRFCVQFVTFYRTSGDNVRKWWMDRCIEWCFARFEAGKFGDQKYLDDWPERFRDEVHVLRQHDLILAPWNATRFPYGPAVAYHFHNLRLLSDKRVMLARGFEIPKATLEGVYGPYLADFSYAISVLAKLGHVAQPQAKKPGPFIQAGVLIRKLVRAFARARPIRVKRLPETG